MLCTGINQGLQALKDGGVPPKLLIIDDGWQTTELDAALRPASEDEAEVIQAEQEVLMVVGKATCKGSGTAVAQLSNQAAVSEKGAHQHHRTHLQQLKDQRQQQQQLEPVNAVRRAWDRLKGWLAGILAAIISTLYTVSDSAVNCHRCMCYEQPCCLCVR